MGGWELPDSAEIAGKEYRINADYRDILNIIARLNDIEEDEQTRVYVAMALFYEGFDTMPESSWPEAVRWLYSFIGCGEEDGSPQIKTIDWEQDRQIIVSDVNKVAGQEIRALPFCHWWTFISWFRAIGDGQLATVVSIREKLRKGKKLADLERDFYRSNRSMVDFKTKYTAQDDDILGKWA